ncbi:MAG: cytochrome-c peroxidase, partial [Deltaproteobacteria bacterium]|nr:cytochrome-c peroxidase [Deltaproteobacteria bacterium]
MSRARWRGRFGALSFSAMAVLFVGWFAAVSPLVNDSSAEEPDPEIVRFLATAVGMDPLGFAVVPQPPTLSTFVREPTAAVMLGKALFWDMQVGSDGQACASCHFHAFAENRAKNQLQPGLSGGDGAFGNNPFTGFIDFPGFGPNYTLTDNHFPFHLLTDPADTNSAVLRDTNDVVSSQGVFHADFLGSDPLQMHDTGSPIPDPVFHVSGINTRRVEPRNTPTVINSVFNFANFWDGRANFFFNGVNPFGPLDESSRIYVNNAGVIVQQTMRMPFASLASQAVGPPANDFEMSFAGRSLPDVGRKLIPRQPLAFQRVHPQDSVLGLRSLATLNPDGTVSGDPGLNTTYQSLIQTAFFPKYWDGTELIGGYTQMEANFSLFFGLAVQMYEATLISGDSPFDEFMDGDDHALTSRQLSGLELFIGKGGCAACHLGPEFTDASVAAAAVDPAQPGFAPAMVELMLMQDQDVSIYDGPFHNNGVRPSAEDLGRGGTAPFINPLTGQPYPLSVSRLAILKAHGLLPPAVSDFVPILDPLIPLDIRVAANGEFKTPGLRNV